MMYVKEYSNILASILTQNRPLSRTYSWTDNTQKVYATAFTNQLLKCSKKISICAILSTIDNKFLACLRTNTFLFTEIIKTKNNIRKKRLFLKYSKYLRKIERRILSLELRIFPEDSDNEYNNIMFPGGIPKPGEDIILCLAREIKEEINIDNKHIFLDSRFFVHTLIEDKLIDRTFETILFLGKVSLTSKEVSDKFLANKEVRSLIFLDTIGEGIEYDIVRYVISISRLKCYGNKGKTIDSLQKKVNELLNKNN
nr:mutT motif protein [Wadden Sea poxvirus]